MKIRAFSPILQPSRIYMLIRFVPGKPLVTCGPPSLPLLAGLPVLGASDRHEVFRSVLGGLLRGLSRPKEKQQDEAAHVERHALLKAEAHETEDQPKQSQGLA